MNRNNVRKLINTIHLWMGLGSGLVIFIVCLSGTAYTFRTEIERWAEPQKYYALIPEGSKPFPADSIIAAIETETGGKATSIMAPDEPSMNWQITVKKTSIDPSKNSAGATSKPKTFFVNPYTRQIAGEQGGRTGEFFTKVMQLHRWLLLDDSTGRIIVGSATIIFVFMILTGLVLWFPARIKNWRQGFRIKTSANWKRINHDLHNTLGFYSFLILLIMALTGLCWSFEWYRNGLSSALGAKVFKGRSEKPVQSDSAAAFRGMAGIDIILTETNKLFHYKGISRLTIPEDSTGAIVVTRNATGFFAVAGIDKAQFDRFTGELLKIEGFGDKPLNVKIADSIKLIHTGELFGTFSKIIYFIVCLIATSLPVTGTMIWLNKMKKKKSSAKPLANKTKELA